MNTAGTSGSLATSLAPLSVQGAMDSNGNPIDAAFYKRFWGLQSVFQNPGPHMKPAPWAGVVSDLQVGLAKSLAAHNRGERRTAQTAPPGSWCLVPLPRCVHGVNFDTPY